jgi:hypothetical protein
MQEMAATTLGDLALNAEDAVTIASAGAIPLLVQLLKPGTRDGVQGRRSTVGRAAGVLMLLAANSENAVTIASAGAIPPLAQLSRSGPDDDIKLVATRALEAIRNGIASNRAAVAAAKASATMVQEMDALGVDSPSDAQTS